MLVLARGIEYALNVTIERPRDADPGEHRRPAMFCYQQKRLHRCLSFVGIVFGLGQFCDVKRGVAVAESKHGGVRKGQDHRAAHRPAGGGFH
jgi:hypothetical protein